jgi:hypothetical protein
MYRWAIDHMKLGKYLCMLFPGENNREGIDPDPAELETGISVTWKLLTRKWRSIPGGLELITDEATPLPSFGYY